jgi:hypothetical protein
MAIRITYHASVTFEYDEAAPQTFRGAIVAPNASLGVRRAVEAARRAHLNAAFRSLVVVLEVGERVELLTTVDHECVTPAVAIPANGMGRAEGTRSAALVTMP